MTVAHNSHNSFKCGVEIDVSVLEDWISFYVSPKKKSFGEVRDLFYKDVLRLYRTMIRGVQILLRKR